MIYCRNFNFSEFGDSCRNATVTARNRDEFIEYYNLPFAFDIETTSFYDGDNKRACMYIFMFSLNGSYIYGRTWTDFDFVLDNLQSALRLNNKRRIIIYIHNLAYEFQFLIGHTQMSDVFARTARHVIKATMNNCFDLKCSYFLSGLSLAKLAEDLTSVKIEKKIGDLDYKKIRHYNTPLTEKELGYCEYDVKILHYFILEEMEKNENNITKIPLTKTGYVRQYCQKYVKKHTNYKAYRDKIIKLSPTDKDLFCLLHKAFQGGYTHANYIHVDTVLNDVYSIDFTSSYPAQMIRHKYPMQPFTKFTPKNLKEFYTLVQNYACVMEIAFTKVCSKKSNHILSRSKCSLCNNGIYDNGRVVKSDYIITYMTDIDFKMFEKFYNYENIGIINMYISSYGYLPKQLIECILKFFTDKTTLKGVAGKEQEYLIGKGMLNGVYGMSVTNPVNDNITFDGLTKEWGTEQKDIEQALYDNYVKNKKQILVYQWGVWVTAWARYELFQGVLKIDDDVVYCDTDSIKFLNFPKYEKWIEQYNKKCEKELEMTMEYYNLPKSALKPKTIKGVECMLGVWDYEGKYDRFKTLGAKRYAYEKDGKYNITVSGLNKKCAVPYLCEIAHKKHIDFFDLFTNDMYIPPEHTGKNTIIYINDPYEIELTDYKGNKAIVSENTYIHMQEQDFNLSMTSEFLNFILYGFNTEFSKNYGIFDKQKELAVNFWEYDWSENNEK